MRNWGDAEADLVALIAKTTDPDNKVRLASVLSLGRRLDRDPRAIKAVANALKDSDGGVIMVAAAALGQAGWIDATLDGCLRNSIIAVLHAYADQQHNATLAAIAAKSVKTLEDLGLLDQANWPPSEKCGLTQPKLPPPVPKPDKPDGDAAGWSGSEKAVVVTAVLAVLGLGAYLVLGGRRQAPPPLQGWEPPRPRRKCPRFAAALAHVETLVQDTDTADWTDLSRRMLTGNMADAEFFARQGDCAAAGNKLAVVRQILRRGRSAAPWELRA